MMGKFFTKTAEEISYSSPAIFRNPLKSYMFKKMLTEPDFNNRRISREYVDKYVPMFLEDLPDKDIKIYVNNLSRVDRTRRVLKNSDLNAKHKVIGVLGSLLVSKGVGDHAHPESKSLYIGTPNPYVTAHEFGHILDYQKNKSNRFLDNWRANPVYVTRSERRASDYAVKKLGKNSLALQAAFNTYDPFGELHDTVFHDIDDIKATFDRFKVKYTYDGNTLKIKTGWVYRKLRSLGVITEFDDIKLSDGTAVKVKYDF